MRVTKRQLRRIIKEEKAKVLVEMNPSVNSERTVGLYFNTNQQKVAFDALSALYDTAVEAAMIDGMEDVEAVGSVDTAIRSLFEQWLADRAR